MNVAGAFGFVVILLAIGKLLGRFRILPENAPAVLNQVVLYVCLPASVLLYASRLRLDAQVLVAASLPWLLLPIGAGAVILLCKACRWPAPVMAVLLLAIPLGNTSFLGYPLVSALLGEQALPHAVIYDQLGSFLILSTYGVLVIAHFGHQGRPTFRQFIGRVLRFPAFLSLVVALTIMPATPSPLIEMGLRRISDALLPIVCLAIGMQVELRLPKAYLAPLGVGLGLKLVLMPAVALLLAHWFHLGSEARQVTVLETGMPPMITAMALASSRGLAPSLAAGLVGYGIVASGITLPLIQWIMQ